MVTVEHVHVHAGGQAAVGTIETRGRGSTETFGSTPCKADFPCTSARVAERGQGTRQSCQSRDADQPMPHARRDIARRSQR
jgi:hypothetical protein